MLFFDRFGCIIFNRTQCPLGIQILTSLVDSLFLGYASNERVIIGITVLPEKTIVPITVGLSLRFTQH